jgi:hypothetical protein
MKPEDYARYANFSTRFCDPLELSSSIQDTADDGIEVEFIAKLRALVRAAAVFSFRTEDFVSDDVRIGFIRDTPIYAGEMRRLNAALKPFLR